MKSSSPPPPPDPNKLARMQGRENRKTAITEANINRVDQTTPYGSLQYRQVGTWSDGTPRYEAVQTLSPEEQAKQEQQWQFDTISNRTGLAQMTAAKDMLSRPIDLNNETTEARLMELGRKRLDPILADRRAAAETQLYNQGVMPGTEAWARVMGGFSGGEENIGSLNMAENDAYNQLLLAGRGQAVNEAALQRSIPMAEIAALMGRGEVQQPSWVNPPTTNVAGVDIAGMTMDAYKYGPLARYQAEQAQQNAMMSGLFGMGGAALGGWASGGFKGF